MDDILENELRTHIHVLEQALAHSEPMIEQLVAALCNCFNSGHKLLLCGNGGSAADAQHIAAEFVNRFRVERNALPAIALTTDSSVLTAIGNDWAYERIFSRQVEALAVKGDIVVGMSTSGHSANVLNAMETARARGAITVGFTGESGQNGLGGRCDYCIVVPSVDTARIQECHQFMWHVICSLTEQRLFGGQA